ncbi:hypothetical protein BaRGS_00019609 [Batillaria attramentaria]|uniref:Secreted protein n=1 Tax=Batillaria attramentaria TaxID=370345 RepID=A0ABD0KPV6_9CAEN
MITAAVYLLSLAHCAVNVPEGGTLVCSIDPAPTVSRTGWTHKPSEVDAVLLCKVVIVFCYNGLVSRNQQIASSLNTPDLSWDSGIAGEQGG